MPKKKLRWTIWIWALAWLMVSCAGAAGKDPESIPQPSPAWGKLEQDKKALKEAIEAFYTKNYRAPANMKELMGAGDPMPDPWGTPYRYRLFNEMEAGQKGFEHEFISAGEDGTFGTADDIRFPEPDPNYRPSPIMKRITDEEPPPAK
jgi:hypothetical protein